ncbi:MAG TPA: thiamine phosphate synthase [Bacteroidia bacterium]
MKIILISSSDKRENEPEMVTKLFELGVDTFHLRKPKFTTRELSAWIDAIPSHFHSRIVIHSHHKLAIKYNLKGIHLTRIHKKRKFRQWFIMQRIRMKGKQIVVSTSFRKLANLYEEENSFSYVFLSPIFDSLSGKFQSGFNEFSLKAAIEKTPHKVIARGGMDTGKIEKVAEIGFYGMAFYSTVWKSADPVGSMTSIFEKLKELGIKSS